MALRLRREGLHQPDHDQAANDRGQDDERTPRVRESKVVGVAGRGEDAEKERVVDERDHRPEDDGAECGNDADDACEHAKDR